MKETEESPVEEAEVEFRSIPLDVVSEGDRVLRRVGNEEKMEELRLSIARYGVLVPIVVVAIEAGYKLVCGRRRVLCARAVGLAEIPALVVKASQEWQSWACLAENTVREQVNPVDEGLWLSEIMVEQGINQRTLAERLQVSEQYVGQRLTTMKWPDDVREAVLDGTISFAVGRELWLITEKSHRKHLLRVAAVSGCTARQAADWRRAWRREREDLFPQETGSEEAPGGESVEQAEGQCAMCGGDISEGKGYRLIVCETCRDAVRLSSSS